MDEYESQFSFRSVVRRVLLPPIYKVGDLRSKGLAWELNKATRK